MRNFKYKKKRTSNFDSSGNKIPDTFNLSNLSQNQYINKNTYFDITHSKNHSVPPNYRNPVLGYRKILKTPKCQPSDSNEPTNTLYQDNWTKNKIKNVSYSNKPPTSVVYNKNGIKNPVYNNHYSQYLQRRVKNFDSLEFHFLSNNPIESCGNEFATAAHNSTPILDVSSNDLKNIDSNIPDCKPNGYPGQTICDVKNNQAKAIYKRTNPKFSKQGAVSGGSRINRLKYQTVLKSQSKGSLNSPSIANGTYPGFLYRNTGPIFKQNNNTLCILKTSRNSLGGLQRCKIKKGLHFSKKC